MDIVIIIVYNIRYYMSDLFCTIDANRKKGLLFNVPPVRYDNLTLSPYLINPSLTQHQLDMRRKVEILQYKKNTNGGMTKKQSFKQAIMGATQRRNYSQAQLGGNVDALCPPTISTAAGIPGPAFYLSLDANVPLYNYTTSRTYATENAEDTVTKWVYTTAYDIFGNVPKLLTLNIKKPIDQSLYAYTFTTSVGLHVSGSSAGHTSEGTFSTKLTTSDITIEVNYGNAPITLIAAPVITFGTGFLTEVSGNLINHFDPSSFSGNIYLGNMTVSNLVLATLPGYTYDIYIKYNPSNTYGFIDTYNSQIISGLLTTLTNSVKKQESGILFYTPVPTTSIGPLSFSG